MKIQRRPVIDEVQGFVPVQQVRILHSAINVRNEGIEPYCCEASSSPALSPAAGSNITDREDNQAPNSVPRSLAEDRGFLRQAHYGPERSQLPQTRVQEL